MNEIERVMNEYVERLISKATTHEKQLRKALESRGVDFVFQHPIIDKKCYILDFYIETTDGRKFAIELDGSQHLKRKAKRYDKKRDSYLFATHKIRVFRFNNPRNKDELNNIVNRIMASKPKRVNCYDSDILDVV